MLPPEPPVGALYSPGTNQLMKIPRPLLISIACVAFGTLLAPSHATPLGPVLLNEIYVNPPGNTLPHEFIELQGPPLQPLDGYFLLAINANPGLAGRVDLALNLSGVQ